MNEETNTTGLERKYPGIVSGRKKLKLREL